MTRTIPPTNAKVAVHGGEEVAFLDVREAGQFADGHPLFAIPCPYSRLELVIGGLVPRRDAPVILIDDGDRVAVRAAAALVRMGYSDLTVVEGGAPAWAAAGFTLYKGVNVPSKTLGELAEHAMHPQTIDAPTLAEWKAEGRKFQFFDCRPADEYAKMRVPGAVCLPNGELAHRYDAAVPDDAPVVITCAGRTRGIIGVVGLSLAGIGGEVFALENGTQGWSLAAEQLERGNTAAPLPELGASAREATRARAKALIAREGIAVIDAARVERLRQEPGRTTYLLDVRSADEASGDPLSAFTHALSGQLVQATDQWVGVRHARLVLADDLGLRAALAAYWLRALGYEVYVLPIDESVRAMTTSARPEIGDSIERCRAEVALRKVTSGRGMVIDVRRSDRFRAGHVAGAVWAVRPRLDWLQLATGTTLFVVGDNEAEAALVARELLAMGHEKVKVVAGGFAAQVAAGAAIEGTPGYPARDEAIDFTWFAHGRHDGNLDASRLYLNWEQGLVAQLDPKERAEFGI